MKFYDKLSLRWKLIGMVLTINILIGSGALFSLSEVERSYKSETLSGFTDSAKAGANALEGQFFERYGDVQAFATNQAVRSMNERAMQESLDQYVSLYGIYDVILVVDTQGRFVASNSKDADGVQVNQQELRQIDFSSTSWFKSISRGDYTEDAERNIKGTLFEGPHVDPVSKVAFGSPRIQAGFTTPIRDASGKTLGYLTNRSRLSWIVDGMMEIHSHLLESGVHDVEVSLVSPSGHAFVNVRAQSRCVSTWRHLRETRTCSATFQSRRCIGLHERIRAGVRRDDAVLPQNV